MRINHFITITFASLLSFATLGAQQSFTVPLYVSNAGGAIDTLRFGLDPSATYGIDDALGEFEYPPFPPTSVFEARFVNVPGNPVTPPEGLGEGVKTDIRRYRDAEQIDTFRIRFQPGDNGFPVTISWPDGISATSGAMTIRSAGKNIDMTAAGSLTVDDPDASVATIIRQGDPQSGVDAPERVSGVLRISATPSVVSGESVAITYESTSGSRVTIDIYSALGDLVARATPDSPAGQLRLESGRLAAGRYFIVLWQGLSTARSSFIVAD